MLTYLRYVTCADHDPKDLKLRLNMAGCIKAWRCEDAGHDSPSDAIRYGERIVISARDVSEIRQHDHARVRTMSMAT